MKAPAVDPAFARAYLAKHGKRIQLSAEQRERQERGESAEEFVADLHDACLAQGIAFVRKLPTPLRVCGTASGGKVLAFFEKKSGVDYVGHMLDGSGRAVFCEVKAQKQPGRFPLSQVKEHQREELTRAGIAGAVAVLVIVLGEGRDLTAYAVPWGDVFMWIEAGAKSLTPAQLTPYRLRPGEAYLARFAQMEGS